MGRAPCCEKMGLKRGPWTTEEDQILISYVQKYGHSNWRALPKQAGLLRCGKSCRLRWTNYLRPDIKRGNFTREEEDSIIHLHETLGNRWSAIAARLPGRTDNEIKNVWHTHLKKRLSQDTKKIHTSKAPNNYHSDHSIITTQSESDNQDFPSSDYASISSQPSSSASTWETSNDFEVEDMDFLENIPIIDDNFWSEQSLDEYFGFSGVKEEVEAQFPLTTVEKVEEGYYQGDNIDDCMGFWYQLFLNAGGIPELAEL